MPQIQIYLSESSPAPHELAEGKTSIGRSEDNLICVNDPSVSSHHAEIVFDGELFHLHDLGSTNGTFVNGEQVTDAVLNLGDEVRFGAIPAVFAGQNDAPAGDAQPLPQSSAPAAPVANQSSIPSNFVSSSPVSRHAASRDTLGIASLAAGIIGLLAAVAAVAMALTMSF